jgi:DNA-binding transcriptional LysR family regulator
MRRFNVKMDGQIAVLTVAEKGSFSAAGKSLEMTTSAVRKQVEGVSAELGAQLFRRAGSRLEPTEVGGIYLPEIRESVRHARLGVDRVQAFVRAKAIDLRIGYSSHLSEQLLDIIVRLQPTRATSSGFESSLTHQVISHVLQGRLHVGFGFLPIQQPELIVRPLMQEPLMACLPPGHRLIAKQSIEPADLQNEPMIAVGRKALPGRHKEIVEYFEGEGVFLNFVSDAYLPKEALWLASRGIGLTLMTRSSAAPVRSDVVLRPLSAQFLTVKSGIFARRDHHVSYITEFIDKAWAATVALRPKSAKAKSTGTQ